MEFLRPGTWSEALAAKGANPQAVAIVGGTDVMVELNFARLRPSALLDLTRVTEMTGWAVVGDRLRVGAAVTYAELTGERGDGPAGGGGGASPPGRYAGGARGGGPPVAWRGRARPPRGAP